VSSCADMGPNAQRNTAIGALGGAAVGGVIGHQSGNAGKGALIGAGAGAIGGNIVGKKQDQNQGYR